jgi:hypothetical protein
MIVGQNSLLNQYVPVFYFTDLVNGQLVMYDSTKRAFINVDPVVATSSIQTLGQLINVSPNVDNPLSLQNGQGLVYNSFTQLWTNQFVDFNTLLNKPTSANYSFIGLSDTTKPSLARGYVQWDPTGTTLVYSTTIPAANITGLALVATTGNYNDLINKPAIANDTFIGLTDTAKPAVANDILKWDPTGSTVIYVSSIPVTQVSGLAPVATVGTFGSLSNVSSTADTLNMTTQAGFTIQWSGTQWVPVNPPMRVVSNLAALLALTPSLGNQAYVINSDDGQGDYINQWSLWIYTISGPNGGWTLLSRQDVSTGASATIESTVDHLTPGTFTIGMLPTGGRITLITVEVVTPYDGVAPTLEIDYNIPIPGSNPMSLPTSGILMPTSQIDLTTVGIYSAISDIFFGVETPSGEIDINATFVSGGSTVGNAQIIVSYV